MKFEIKSLLNESIVELLNENRLEYLIKTYTGKDAKFKITPKILLQLMNADPTTRPQNATDLQQIQKVGNYVQWLILQLKKIWPTQVDEKGKIIIDADSKERIRLFFEDLYRLTTAIEKYDVMKRKNMIPADKKDIMRLSKEELDDLTFEFDLDAAKKEDEQLAQAKQVKKERSKEGKYVYEDERWQVIIPLTYEFSRTNFGTTQWCTASSGGRGNYDYYTGEGPLYVFIDKTQPPPVATLDGKPVLQVHFGKSIQFKDVRDREINVNEFFKDQIGLKNFFQPIIKDAIENRPFSMEDRLWQVYIGLYGMEDDEVKEIVENSFRKLVQRDAGLVVTDTRNFHGTDISAYLTMLGYDGVLHRIFQYVKPESTNFEIKFENYDGEGFDIPDDAGKVHGATIFVFSGFVRSIAPGIAHAKNLEMLCIDENPNLTTLPEELCNAPKLEVINHMNSPIKFPPCLQKKIDSMEIIIL